MTYRFYRDVLTEKDCVRSVGRLPSYFSHVIRSAGYVYELCFSFAACIDRRRPLTNTDLVFEFFREDATSWIDDWTILVDDRTFYLMFKDEQDATRVKLRYGDLIFDGDEYDSGLL